MAEPRARWMLFVISVLQVIFISGGTSHQPNEDVSSVESLVLQKLQLAHCICGGPQAVTQ